MVNAITLDRSGPLNHKVVTARFKAKNGQKIKFWKSQITRPSVACVTVYCEPAIIIIIIIISIISIISISVSCWSSTIVGQWIVVRGLLWTRVTNLASQSVTCKQRSHRHHHCHHQSHPHIILTVVILKSSSSPSSSSSSSLLLSA